MVSAGEEGRAGTRVVYGGVDTARFSPGGGAGDRVLFVGRLLPHKGVEHLIEALPAGMGLDVAGPLLDERYASDLRGLAQGKDVAFHHDWDDARLADAYRAALCVALPSVYTDRYGSHSPVPELLGQTLLEGMASGRPAVCTRVGGMPEVVADGVTGFVVPPGDPAALRAALERLRDDRALAGALGAAGRDHVLEHFTWARTVERCLDAYGPEEGWGSGFGSLQRRRRRGQGRSIAR